MNLIIKLFLIVFILSNFSSVSYSEITDKRVYDNFYNGCMLEQDSSVTYDQMSNYCSCAGNNIMKNFTIEELMMLEGKILSSDEENQLKIAMANEKFLSAIAKCAEKIYN